MGTSADKLALLKATKADLKAALTEKGQTPGDVFSDYPDLVRAIETGTQLPELTSPGGAADLRKGKQLIDQSGAVVNGTLANVEQATPSISVSSAGLITATANQVAGIVTEGRKTATLQLSSSMDPDFVAANIKEGSNIFGVSGSAPNLVMEALDRTSNIELTSTGNYSDIQPFSFVVTLSQPISRIHGVNLYARYKSSDRENDLQISMTAYMLPTSYGVDVPHTLNGIASLYRDSTYDRDMNPTGCVKVDETFAPADILFNSNVVTIAFASYAVREFAKAGMSLNMTADRWTVSGAIVYKPK